LSTPCPLAVIRSGQRLRPLAPVGLVAALLVITGLQQRDRTALRIAGAAAALTVPVALLSL
jgi:hypothetical protein